MPKPITRRSWQQARQIFEDALDLTNEDRQALVRDRCQGNKALQARVEELLGWHHEAQGFISRPVLSPAAPEPSSSGPLESPDTTSLVGRSFGAYRLVRLLGEGGMGIVFLAERSDDSYRKRVAVKLLRGGLHSQVLAERFRNERQILADLEHPNIAKLLDGGTADDGRPYLVMEYVDGVPIDTYCNGHGLAISERLQLFLSVAAAVGYAHRKLVVHRDLKPSNILIDAQGEPKLLDFGIAKLLDSAPMVPAGPVTQFGQMLMTPEYASPEQVGGDSLSAASDVYSLGVILYELLTGRSPYRLGRRRLEDLVRAVCETEPSRPSSVATLRGLRPGAATAQPHAAPQQLLAGETRRLRRQLTGDLDAIVLQALRKNPEERYASVDRLVLDIENQLAGRPVAARHDTLAYRCTKFVRRHRLATALGVSAFLAMFSLLVTLASQRQALLSKQGQLVRERNRAEAVSEFIADVFSMPDPTRSQGEQVTARDLLDRGVRQIESGLGSESEERADLLLTMGRSYMNLGLLEDAEPLLASSVALRRPPAATDPGALAKGLVDLAKLHSLAGRYREGLQTAREAVQLLRDSPSADRRQLALALAHWGRGLERVGDHSAAEQRFREALELAREADHGPTLAAVLDRYGMLHSERASLSEAEATFQEAVALWATLRGDGSPEVALARNNFGLVLLRQGDYARAREQFQEAEAAQRKLYEQNHPHLATTLSNLGLLDTAMGHFEEADIRFQEALAIGRLAYRGDHPKLAGMIHNYGDLAAARGDHAEAETRYRQALDSRTELLGERHPETAATLNNLARMLRVQGDIDQALAAFEQALDWSLESLGEAHPQVAAILNNLAEVHHTQGELDRAGELYRRSLAINRAVLGPRHPGLAAALHNLASLEQKLGRLAAAEQRYQEALEVMTVALGEEHLNVAMTRTSLASLKGKRGDHEGAEELSRWALERFAAELPADNPWTISARRILARGLQAQGRFAEAETLLLEAQAALLEKQGPESPATKQIIEALAAFYQAWGKPGPDEDDRARQIP